MSFKFNPFTGNLDDTGTAPSAGIGGSTGSTDNAILRADGTGGATLQGSTIRVTDTGNMQFGGATSSEAMLKPVTHGVAGLDFRLADDSNYAQTYNGGWYTYQDTFLAGIGVGDVTHLRLSSAVDLPWTSTDASGVVDTALVRTAAGVVEVNNGTAGQSGVLLLRGRAFANLPASPVAGMVTTVTDSNTATWGATIAGGGANTVLAFYNGSNWTVFPK